MTEYRTGICSKCGHTSSMSVMRMGSEHTLLCIKCYSKKNKDELVKKFGKITLCPECLTALDMKKDNIQIWNGKPICDSCYRIKISSRKL